MYLIYQIDKKNCYLMKLAEIVIGITFTYDVHYQRVGTVMFPLLVGSCVKYGRVSPLL